MRTQRFEWEGAAEPPRAVRELERRCASAERSMSTAIEREVREERR